LSEILFLEDWTMTLPVMFLINLIIIVILGFGARLIKVSGETISGGWNFGFTTQDLILLAVIGAISGVINTGMGIVWNAANAAGGPLAGAALQGAFMWAYLLAFFLVKKPGSMLIVGLLETAIEALLGNPSGVATLGWGLMQGLGAEVVMAICNYKDAGWLAFGLAGAAASQFGTVWTAYLFGWDTSPQVVGQYWTAAPINLISGFIISGLLGFALGRMIAKTGLVRAARTK
jgi:energy-coupling factor transport system substrate-specific component